MIKTTPKKKAENLVMELRKVFIKSRKTAPTMGPKKFFIPPIKIIKIGSAPLSQSACSG